MNILFIGDVFGKVGRKMIEKNLSDLKEKHSVDLVIANVENIAHGKGTRKKDIEQLRAFGVDVFTGGNHSFDHKDFAEVLNEDDDVLRPLNYPNGAPGKGYCIKNNVLIINAIGRVFMPEGLNSPFDAIQEILDIHVSDTIQAVFLDFHAETTSEKRAVFHNFDGKISALIGTHTHVQTADEYVSEFGSAYLSDAGMTGPEDSVIGMKKELVIKKFTTALPVKFEPSDAKGVFCGAVISVENMKAQSIQRIFIREE